MMAAVMKAPHYPAPSPRVPVRARALAVLALLALLAGCGSSPPVRTSATPAQSWPSVTPADPAAANAVTLRALSLVGTPYRYGGNTPESGFDCSGLVNYVYRDMLELRLPRTSRELAALQGPRVQPERLTSGDLVFFGSGRDVSHVGIYVGEGRFVHAPAAAARSGWTVWTDHTGVTTTAAPDGCCTEPVVGATRFSIL